MLSWIQANIVEIGSSRAGSATTAESCTSRPNRPAIQAETGGTMAALQWLIGIYTIPLAALLLSAGVLADRIGAGRLFLWALGGFTVASLACALSPTLPVLLGFRCLQGVFGAGILPTTLALITRLHPEPARRARAITVWGATGGIALIVGPVGGGVLTEVLGWRSIFLVNVPIGLVACVAVDGPDRHAGAARGHRHRRIRLRALRSQCERRGHGVGRSGLRGLGLRGAEHRASGGDGGGCGGTAFRRRRSGIIGT
ncbi:MFS transporter [Nocardia sp. NPDC056064]|uniref:MFS transporter n=1 Tax=Nocardia sp. NPDC056064 TaxID=3345701 RepID=UPI0035E0A0E0